jgi:hypothetical protein
MFLPQSWSSSTGNLSTLKRFIPAVNDFSRVWKETQDQASIGKAAGDDMYRKFEGIPSTYGNPAPVAETANAQLDHAFNMQRNWFDSYANIIDHNGTAASSGAQTVNFPLSPEWGKWGGEPITKANIRMIINQKYPAYSPTSALDAAVASNQAVKEYVLSTKGTDLHQYVQTFVSTTDKLGQAMSRPNIPVSTVQQFTSSLRQQASYLAERDPAFYKVYNKSFRRVLGPLEVVARDR